MRYRAYFSCKMWDVPYLDTSDWLISNLRNYLEHSQYSWSKNPYIDSDDFTNRPQEEDLSMKETLLEKFERDMAYSSVLMSREEAESLLGNFVDELTDGGTWGDIIFDDWDVEEQHTFEFGTIAFCTKSKRIATISICDED
jgi:hypothetical protein